MGGERKPGINCVHALNFPRFWGELDIFRILSMYLPFNPCKRSAELQEGQIFEATSEGLTEHSWPHSIFFSARMSRR